MTTSSCAGKISAGEPTLDRLVLGVDGGGTKTTAWLARRAPGKEPNILGRGVAGSSNVRAAGVQVALENLKSAVELAWSDAQRTPQSACCAVLALSGSGHPQTQSQVLDWANKQQLAEHVQIVHDAAPVLSAGTPEGKGVALIAGTGAVAYGTNAKGTTYVAGGWGYLFGDEGSAYWLGQAALGAISQASDGRGPSTTLEQCVLERLKISEAREILSTLQRNKDVRQTVASLADLVTEAAVQGDTVAEQIVQQGVDHLAALVQSVAQELLLGKDFPLALTGGVLCGCSQVRKSLREGLSRAGLKPTPIELVLEPVAGCVKLACEFTI